MVDLIRLFLKTRRFEQPVKYQTQQHDNRGGVGVGAGVGVLRERSLRVTELHLNSRTCLYLCLNAVLFATPRRRIPLSLCTLHGFFTRHNTVICSILENGTDRLFRNVDNYEFTLRKIQAEPRLDLHGERKPEINDKALLKLQQLVFTDLRP